MTPFLALLAGILSTLSPCVLPLLPVVLGTAASEHRGGPAALAAGLALSFTAIGLFVALIGFSIGIDLAFFSTIGGLILLLVGAVLLVPKLQAMASTAAGPIATQVGRRIDGFAANGLGGQFTLGLLLGTMWTPCVGPTLGAASMMAARGENLGQVTLTMSAFGIGVALPLMLVGMASREALLRWRGRLLGAGQTGRMALGAVLVTVGILVVTGTDRCWKQASYKPRPTGSCGSRRRSRMRVSS